MKRIWFNFLLAMEAVFDNKLRALLTALGIVFGVAAVIAMLAIGTGAKTAILEQMKLIGTNNIEITSILEREGEESQSETPAGKAKKPPYSKGLTLEDVESIMGVVPEVKSISPEIVIPTSVIYGKRLEKTRCVGINNAFFELNNIKIESGQRFHPRHLQEGKSVCIIGQNIAAKFFAQENPLGKRIKCGNTWLTIIGVLSRRFASSQSLEELGIRDYNDDVYMPVRTALLRFRRRGVVDERLVSLSPKEGLPDKYKNYHQLDRLVVNVGNSDFLPQVADVIARMLKRRHNTVVDFELRVPELLLKQQQKTQETFNLVLGAIAGISLLVGGIGIMNIMLASVLERIKEIGVRRSLGATRKDIVWQFLFESIFISLVGGIIGIILGVTTANLIARTADIPTVVSAWSVLLSFGVAAGVGLVFGLFPARKAAHQDPIKALRRE